MSPSEPRSRVWRYLVPPSGFGRSESTVVSAHGTRVRFADGVEAQCATSGLWNVNFGYGNEVVADAVDAATRSVGYLPLFRHSHPWAEQAADDLVGLVGAESFSHVLFSTSGSAANDAIMKLARQWGALTSDAGRNLIIGFTGSYHGQTYGSAGVSGDDLGQDLYRVDRRFIRHVDPFDTEAVARLIDREGSRIAAFVVEPVLGSGTKPVPTATIDLLLERRAGDGFLVVADEVATGFFRTGSVLATNRWSARPDVLLMSKGLTNGACAAAAIALSPRVSGPFVDHDATFIHGETQGGSPPSCAAMSAVVRLATSPENQQAAATACAALDAGLIQLEAHPLVTQRRGAGCFQTLTVSDLAGTPVSGAQHLDVLDSIRRAGAWVYPGPGGIQIIPPVISTTDDITRLIGAIGDGLDDVMGRRVDVALDTSRPMAELVDR